MSKSKRMSIVLFPRLPYNVGMKDKEIKVKVNTEFIEKVDYLQRINDYKSRSDCIRKTVEKEYRKERTALCEECALYDAKFCFCTGGYVSHEGWHECLAFERKEKEDGHTDN